MTTKKSVQDTWQMQNKNNLYAISCPYSHNTMPSGLMTQIPVCFDIIRVIAYTTGYY